MSDAELVREGLQRQPGCPDPTCLACVSRQARIDAGERVLRALAQAESERDTARAFYEVECQHTIKAVERMIAAERSESALRAKVARAVALLQPADGSPAVRAALEALRP